MHLEVGQCVRPFPGEQTSGDVALICPGEGTTVAALVDGLGHGPSAAKAGEACVTAFRENAKLGVEDIFMAAHRALRATRGAAASLARIAHGERAIDFAGIGNVTALVVRSPRALGSPRTTLLLTPGVLGSAYRKVRTQRVPFEPGDTLVFYTDGIRGHVDIDAVRALSPQDLANDVVKSMARSTDDAGCVVVRAVAI
jgi:hypothetical protein